MTSKAYNEARAKHDHAYRQFAAIREDYTNVLLSISKRPSDATFLEAKRIYEAASAEFDKAFEAEQKRKK